MAQPFGAVCVWQGRHVAVAPPQPVSCIILLRAARVLFGATVKRRPGRKVPRGVPCIYVYSIYILYIRYIYEVPASVHLVVLPALFTAHSHTEERFARRLRNFPPGILQRFWYVRVAHLGGAWWMVSPARACQARMARPPAPLHLRGLSLQRAAAAASAGTECTCENA